MHYSLYRFVIAIDHFSNEMTFTEYLQEEEQSQLEALISTVQTIRFNAYTFNAVDEESCFTSSKTFLDQVNTAQQACRDGNIFQIVISRRFKQKFKGDEFSAYRKLRSVNPSPYLFYFDFGDFKIFGSSPEAQLIVNNNKAEIVELSDEEKSKQEINVDTNQDDLIIAQKEKTNTENIKPKVVKKNTDISNIVKDVEYLTTDKNGNKYRILARSGRTNKNDKDILDLDNVKGEISSKKRSTIVIISEFAEYNSSTLGSKFYKNVVINYEDKQITCENFDINMNTNRNSQSNSDIN